MKRTLALLSLLILAAASALPAQSPATPAAPKPATPTTPAARPAAKPTAAQIAQSQAAAKAAAKKAKKSEVHLKPLSSIAFGGGMSLIGVNMQASTNLNRYLNLRGTGNYFTYTANNLNVNNFDVNGKVNLATAGVSVDYFPFPNHGFRISPGVLFYNQNGVSATGTLSPTNHITLNHQDIYSDSTNPLTVGGYVDLNAHKQAFTLTTGWGNVIPRKHQDQVSSHLTFPFEFGLAFTGTPALNLTLNGDACMYTPTFTCDNLTDTTPGSVGAQAQSDLNNQLGIWRADVNKQWYYKVTPIVSFGISYSFNLRQPQ
ncbi:MAG: hypothetical protein WB424_16980 [Terracidiphilus sp.]